MNINETARRNIASIAGFQRLSYRELARKADMSHVVLMRRINGGIAFDLHQLEALAAALGADAAQLVSELIELPVRADKAA